MLNFRDRSLGIISTVLERLIHTHTHMHTYNDTHTHTRTHTLYTHTHARTPEYGIGYIWSGVGGGSYMYSFRERELHQQKKRSSPLASVIYKTIFTKINLTFHVFILLFLFVPSFVCVVNIFSQDGRKQEEVPTQRNYLFTKWKFSFHFPSP